MSTNAIDELTAGFRETFARLGRDAEHDRSVVVTSWPSVPVEIVRAAGFEPVHAIGGSGVMPMADVELEAEIFPSRLRNLVEAALTGRLSNVAAIVLPRTSDPDYKCFLYLREFVRVGVVATLPPVLLFDMLHSDGADVPAYDIGRARDLLAQLAALAGSDPTSDDLRLQILRANAARAAARRVEGLRRGVPRLSGVEAFGLLGAFWQLPPERYAGLAESAADQIAGRTPLTGPRILLAGAPADSPGLHVAIESHGGIVVGEITPWGSGAAVPDVSTEGDVLASLIEHYRTRSIDARTTAESVRDRIEASLADIDAVAVSLPPDDAVFGWDYPRLRETLERRSIPHTILRGDPASGTTAADDERLAALVLAATRRQAVRYG